MAVKIFISYRRDDSAGHAGRIHDRLEHEFGRNLLFMDVDAIPLGVNFVRALREEVAKCDALLVVIGPNWLDARDEAGVRRLDNPNDFVRIEIAAALQREIPVIPILLDGAKVPRPNQLPKNLQELALRNGLEVRHASFRRDMDKLIWELKSPLGQVGVSAERRPRRKGSRKTVAAQRLAESNSNRPKAKVEQYRKREKSRTIGDAQQAQLPNRQTIIAATPQIISIEVGSSPERRTDTNFVPGEGRKTWFNDILEGPEMVVLPAGKFLMGSPPDQEGRWETHEGPQHEVLIPQPFAIGRFAITVAEFTAFIESTEYSMPDELYTFEGTWELRRGRSFRKPGFRQTSRHPVVGINWNDSKAYIAWLVEKTSKPYRLPSEAEWEYAARAGTTTSFWWGDSVSTSQANYDGSAYGSGEIGVHRGATMPVDSFDPNPWGLYQVHGNVSEWCEDCWNPNHRGAPNDCTPRLHGDCSHRVLRGGSWVNSPRNLRSSNRIRSNACHREFNVGFRVARSI